MSRIRQALPYLIAIIVSSCAQDVTHAQREADSATERAMKAALAAADAAAAIAPPPKRILRVTILDERSRKPVYRAGLNLEDRAGLGWTNEKGQHEWWNDQMADSGKILIRCPAKRAFAGRRLRRVPYSLTGHLAEVIATINADECIEPPEKSTTGTFTGNFSTGFEYSRFVPCAGLPADANFYGSSSSGAWVDFTKSSWNEFKKLLPAEPDAVKTGVYVEWVGVLKGPGSYGHLGGNSYQFDVNHVLKVSREPPENCRTPSSVN